MRHFQFKRGLSHILGPSPLAPEANRTNPSDNNFQANEGAPSYFQLKNRTTDGLETQLLPSNDRDALLARFKAENRNHLDPDQLKALQSLREIIDDPNTSLREIIGAVRTGQAIGLEKYLTGDLFSRFGVSSSRMPSLTDPIFQHFIKLYEMAMMLGLQGVFRISPQSSPWLAKALAADMGYPQPGSTSQQGKAEGKKTM